MSSQSGQSSLMQKWRNTDIKVRILLGVLVGCMVVFLAIRAFTPAAPAPGQATSSTGSNGPNGSNAADGGNAAGNVSGRDPNHVPMLPDTPRNQGLEVLNQRIDDLEADVRRLRSGAPDPRAAGVQAPALAPSAPAPTSATAPANAASGAPAPANSPAASQTRRTAGRTTTSDTPVDLDAALPGPIDLGALSEPRAAHRPTRERKAGARPDAGAEDLAGGASQSGVLNTTPGVPTRSELKVWPEEPSAATAALTSKRAPDVVIPVNSALEAVMLSGINARPSGSIVAAVGSVNSANSVGAPFVTRIKGQAIMPNGWRLAELGDCFLGGAGTAVLSAERAYVIADTMSCIAAGGEVWEGPVKAYGLDADGTLGLAGKVVSKQGSLLLQAALTGMASGLGSALSPSTLPSYNGNATSGQTAGIQSPNLRLVGETAVGQGINQATGQLSKFYLDYAREVFPVVEVTSGTRVTWVLTASVELKRRYAQNPQKAVSP